MHARGPLSLDKGAMQFGVRGRTLHAPVTEIYRASKYSLLSFPALAGFSLHIFTSDIKVLDSVSILFSAARELHDSAALASITCFSSFIIFFSGEEKGGCMNV